MIFDFVVWLRLMVFILLGVREDLDFFHCLALFAEILPVINEFGCSNDALVVFCHFQLMLSHVFSLNVEGLNLVPEGTKMNFITVLHQVSIVLILVLNEVHMP